MTRIGALLDPSLIDSGGRLRPEDLALESWGLAFWGGFGGMDVESILRGLAERLGCPPEVLSVWGNPLAGDEAGDLVLSSLETLIELAARLGTPLVSTFAGRLPGKSVPESIGAWKAAFAPLCDRAAALGLAIAFENCRLGDTWKTGRWNLAIGPDAWELMFDALPGAPIGLEWEPAHQVLAFADPLLQLKTWAGRILHVHGKDARIDPSLLARHGIHGAAKPGMETLPGQGDTDWARVIALLDEAGYPGSIDVEIGSTPGFEGETGLEGIALSLAALRKARAAALGALP